MVTVIDVQIDPVDQTDDLMCLMTKLKVNIKIGRFKKLVILVSLVSFETRKICEKCCKNFLTYLLFERSFEVRITAVDPGVYNVYRLWLWTCIWGPWTRSGRLGGCRSSKVEVTGCRNFSTVVRCQAGYDEE